ncbi:MAG: multiheme c-type cytochrome [Desulfomonilaceae bacterium]
MVRFRLFCSGLVKTRIKEPWQAFIILSIGALLFLPICNLPAWCEDSSPTSDWFVDMNRFSKSAHGSLKCDRCHGEMTLKDNVHPNRKDPAAITKNSVNTYDYKRCAACHPESYKRYLLGEHAKALVKQAQDQQSANKPLPPERLAPTCGNCHTSHYVRAKLSRTEIGDQMVETCGNCHPSQKSSYLKNLHGQLGVFLNKKTSAYCTDCHGAHTCKSLKNKDTALQACRRCHRNAPPSFASILIHTGSEDISAKDPKEQAHIALIETIKRIGEIFTILVLAFFALQTFVWILRELHNRLRGR